MSLRTISLVAVFSALVTGQAYAATFTQGVLTPPDGFFGSSSQLIDFDHLPSGEEITEPTDISDQYAAWGVIFNEGKEGFEAPAAFGYPTYDFVDAVSLPNSLIIGDPVARNNNYPIIVDFKDAAFSLLPTSVGFVFTDASPNNPFIVQTFDASDNLIELARIELDWNNSFVPFPGDDEDTFVGLQSPAGISRIQMQMEHPDPSFSSGFEIDDFQFNGTLVPDPTPDPPGDYNGNGRVEQADLDLVLLNWGASFAAVPSEWVQFRPTAGIVDQSELDGVLLNWGNAAGPGSSAAVPEPGAAILALLCIALAGKSMRNQPWPS